MTIEELDGIVADPAIGAIHISKSYDARYWLIRHDGGYESSFQGTLSEALDDWHKAVHNRALRTRIVDKLDAGTLCCADPDYIEYMASVRDRQGHNDSP